jgi:capsular exopolysaccharide synthesis family protein
MQYGGAYGGRSPSENDDLVGTITLSRIFRVIGQRWLTVLVFLLIGLVVAFAVYRISPTIYEAKSEFTMDMRRPQVSSQLGQMVEPDYGSTYEEVFNTRLSDWRSDKVIAKILQQYRADFPSSTITDAEIYEALAGSELDLIRHSRLITIAVRSKSAALASALANAYAQAIESFTDEENKLRCDKAVAQIHEQVEKQRRKDEDLAKALLDFRTKNKVDNLRSEREILQQSLQKTTAELLALESQVTAAAEWEKVLDAAQENPENFGSLPSDVPRSSEIAQAYTRLQEAKMEMAELLAKFTKNHPEVKAKEKALESIKQYFVDAVSRALATAHGNLASYNNQLSVYKKNSEALRKKSVEIEHQIVSADAGLQQLEREKEVASELYQNLLQKEHEARIQAEQNNEIVRVGRPAQEPQVPVLPNPMIIFAAGFLVSLISGLLFVLILDNVEDTIVSLSDLEVRLSLKVLAVLPHIRRKKREQVAKYIIKNKYSQFAEGIAGLRNLLDSPRYQPITQALLCISTQPGEGKTVSSCSIAISNAMAGRKTLLVDFDLRRPRLAKVFDLNLTEENSFSHFLSRDKASDFQSLVNKTEVECLDVIASLPPDNVNPASIMGSHILVEFFQWARANYSRIIVDSPPFGIVGDVVTLSGLVDSVIILCCPEKSHFKPIQHCSRTLREAGATILGVLVNDVEVGSYGNAFNETGSRYGYGYGGYGGYGGYRAYGDHRSYQPYAPTETKEKIDSEEDDDESVNSEVGSESSDDKSVVEEKKAAEVESSSDYADED